MLPLDDHNKMKICPSVLSADFANLWQDVETVLPEADWLHFDVMDGHYVPNISFGPAIAAAIKPQLPIPLDVHLMVTKPELWVEPFAKAGADLIVVHQEVAMHGHRLLQQIKATGCAAGMSLNPGTPIETLTEYLPYLDVILLMSVNPGFGGQSYIDTTDDKIRRTREMIDRSGYKIYLQVDGGISEYNIARVAGAGADAFVAGSAVFSAKDRLARIRSLRNLAEQAVAG